MWTLNYNLDNLVDQYNNNDKNYARNNFGFYPQDFLNTSTCPSTQTLLDLYSSPQG